MDAIGSTMDASFRTLKRAKLTRSRKTVRSATTGRGSHAVQVDRVRRGWIAVVFALACACRSEDLTQTVIWLDAETQVKDVLSHVTVEAVGPADRRLPAVETSNPDWPIKLVLAPKDGDASRRFTLRIEAHDADDKLRMTLRFKTGFVANRSSYVKLVIRDACVARPQCDAGDSSCNVWSLSLATDELGASKDEPRTLKATCSAEQAAPPNESDTPTEGDTHPTGTMMQADTGVAGGSAGSAVSGTAGAAGSQPTGPVECALGFVLNADQCVDIDECATGSPCGQHGRCENSSGAFQCQCEAGYQGRSGSCTDIDECQTNNGGCETTCVNSIGGAACSCAAEDWLKADRKGCGGFEAARRLGYAASNTPSQPRFAFDANGNGLAVWTQSDGTSTYLWTRRYVAGTGWSGLPTKLAISDTGVPSAPRLALDAAGRGVIVWVQTANSHGDIWGVRYDGEAFGQAAKIETDDAGSAFDPSIALNGEGDGFAAWSQSDGTHSRIWVNRFRADLSWTGVHQIPSSDTDDAFAARLAVGSDGSASLVWTQSYYVDMETSRVTPWGARFDAGLGSWRVPTMLDDTGASGFPDTQVFEPDSRGLVVFPRYVDGRVSILARDYSTGSGWSDSVEIAEGDSELTVMQPRVALSTSGVGAAVWVETQASVSKVWTNRYDGTSKTWVGAAPLAPLDSATAPFPQLAIDPSGDGFVLWSETSGTSRTIWVWRLQADVGFLGGVKLTSDVTADPAINSTPQIAVDAKGNAVAIWDVLNAGQYEVWATRFQ